jgi:hypothetical protein
MKNNMNKPDEAFYFWGEDEESKKNALNASGESLQEYAGIQHASAGLGRTTSRTDFSNVLPNISSRPGLSRSDYDYFRPQESVPEEFKAILRRADDIYQRVGLVKNVIDLMGDFASQGITVSHPNKRIERFCRNWFKKINGKDRSERFLNNLYRSGNIVMTRQTAKLSNKSIQNMYKANAADFSDTDIKSQTLSLGKKEIPWRYTFIDPVYIEIAAGPLASFVGGKRAYGLKLPAHLRKIINSPKNDAEKFMVAKLPPEVIEAAKTRKPYYLDADKVVVNHYKKDDWQTWAYPMIYSIMDDITVLEKLKLADMAALDGAISNIRIFKLGNLDHKIAPTKAAASKLASILQNNVGGGTMDIVWGPDIELLESNTNVHQFLGEAKYTPHLNNVYAGLGIPPTLTGTYGAAGTTNNFISLKTLTQRLQYGRDVLQRFWQAELDMIQKSMGFRYSAKVEFDRMDLSNEEAEKALIVQLADRNIISNEFVQKRFGADPDLEKVRINREDKERASNRMTQKLGPYTSMSDNLKKVALQLGIATPNQVGLLLDEKLDSEETLLELKSKFAPQKEVQGVSGQGRPKNSKDSDKRKDREFAPQTGASLMMKSIGIQDKIADIINPVFLEFYNKKNMRSLSQAEYDETDRVKTSVLFAIKPSDVLTEDLIKRKIIASQNLNAVSQYENFIKQIKSNIDKDLTTEDYKQLKAYFYSMVYG